MHGEAGSLDALLAAERRRVLRLGAGVLLLAVLGLASLLAVCFFGQLRVPAGDVWRAAADLFGLGGDGLDPIRRTVVLDLRLLRGTLV